MSEPKVTRRKLADYRQHSNNPNRHTERGLQIVEDSVNYNGAGRSGLAANDGTLLAGNGTWEAMERAGIQEVIEVETDGHQWVIVKRNDLSPHDARAKALMVSDNRSSELGYDPDTEMLTALLKDIEAESKDLLKGAGFEQWELQALLDGLGDSGTTPGGDASAVLSRAEELREQWGVERGQLWIIGRHRLLCGDSYSQADIDRLMDGKHADMLHTDPPYGINIVKPKSGNSAADSGGAKPFGSTAPANRKGEAAVAFRNSRVGKTGGGRGDLLRHHAHNVGRADPANIVQSNLYPVIEGDDRPFDPSPYVDFAPVVVLWGANYYADKLPISSCWIVWDKREDITRNNFADCELAWTNQDKPARLFHHLWNGLHKGSQWGERRLHPTEKPVALFEEIGKMYADGGLWVDLFAGSGAQIVAAQNTGATCYALEYEPLYVASIIQRLADMGLTPARVE